MRQSVSLLTYHILATPFVLSIYIPTPCQVYSIAVLPSVNLLPLNSLPCERVSIIQAFK